MNCHTAVAGTHSLSSEVQNRSHVIEWNMCRPWCDVALQAYHVENLSVAKTCIRLNEHGFQVSSTTVKKYLQKHDVYRSDPSFYGPGKGIGLGARTGWMSIKRQVTQCEHCGHDYEPVSRTQRWCKTCCPTIADSHRMQAYQINKLEYDALIVKSGGRCEICGEKPLRTLHIDHDHTTGHVRGMLCNACNRTLGYIETRKGWINAMQVYLSGP